MRYPAATNLPTYSSCTIPSIPKPPARVATKHCPPSDPRLPPDHEPLLTSPSSPRCSSARAHGARLIRLILPMVHLLHHRLGSSLQDRYLSLLSDHTHEFFSLEDLTNLINNHSRTYYFSEHTPTLAITCLPPIAFEKLRKVRERGEFTKKCHFTYLIAAALLILKFHTTRTEEARFFCAVHINKLLQKQGIMRRGNFVYAGGMDWRKEMGVKEAGNCLVPLQAAPGTSSPSLLLEFVEEWAIGRLDAEFWLQGNGREKVVIVVDFIPGQQGVRLQMYKRGAEEPVGCIEAYPWTCIGDDLEIELVDIFEEVPVGASSKSISICKSFVEDLRESAFEFRS